MLRRTILAALVASFSIGGALAGQGPRIGPTFPSELAAAGCIDGVSWSADGTLTLNSGVDPACPNRVLAAHDPTTALPTPRRASLSALLDPLSPAQRASITADHMGRLQAENVEQGGSLPVGNAKVARAAADLGMTPDAWFKLAGF